MEPPKRMRETVDLKSYALLLWRRKWVVLLPMLLTSIIGWIVTMPRFMRPVYRCSATLMIELPRSVSKELASIVNAPSIAERMARMQSQIQSDEFLTILIDRANMRDDPWVQDWAKKNKKRYPDMSESDLADLWLRRYLRGTVSMQARGDGTSNLITVAVADYYPERAEALVRNIANNIIEANKSAQREATQATEVFSTTQLLEYKQKLQDAEARLEAFNRGQAGRRITAVLVTEPILPQVEEMRNGARDDLAFQRSQAQASAQRLAQLGGSSTQVDAILRGAAVARAITDGKNLEETYVRQSILDAGSLNSSARATALQLARGVEGTRSDVRSGLAATALGGPALDEAEEYAVASIRRILAETRVAAYDRHLREFSNRVVSAPEAEIEMRRLLQDVEYYRELHEVFVNQIASSQISEAYQASQVGERISILEPPQRPLKPSKPNRPAIVAMSVLVGMSLGLFGAFFLEHNDQTFRDVRELEDALHTSVIGTVPNLPALNRRVTPKTPGERAPFFLERLYSEFLQDSPGYREFRRTSLSLLRGGEGGPATMLLTSARSEEGKSTAAACLAMTLARELPRERVILVDLDARKPSLARMSGLDWTGADAKSPDVSMLLREQRWDDAALRPMLLPNFWILPMRTGADQHGGTVTAESIRWLLKELRQRADRIVLDGPPNLPVPDPLVIGPEVDAVLMVVKAGSTPRETVRRSFELQRHFHDNIAGVVMNNVAEVLPYYYQYSHYGYESRARG